MDVTFDDGKVERDVTCTPMHAALLHHFGQKRRWTLAELAAALGVRRDASPPRPPPQPPTPPDSS